MPARKPEECDILLGVATHILFSLRIRIPNYSKEEL